MSSTRQKRHQQQVSRWRNRGQSPICYTVALRRVAWTSVPRVRPWGATGDRDLGGTDKRLGRGAIAERASFESGDSNDTTKTELVRVTLGLVGSTRRRGRVAFWSLHWAPYEGCDPCSE